MRHCMAGVAQVSHREHCIGLPRTDCTPPHIMVMSWEIESLTLLRLYRGEAGSSWPLRTGSALIFGSKTTKDLIMNSSAMTLPMAAAPAKISTCAFGIFSHLLCRATGSATATAATHIACIHRECLGNAGMMLRGTHESPGSGMEADNDQ